VGGEEGKRNPRREATQKILWEYLWERKKGKKSSCEREMVCGEGRKEGHGDCSGCLLDLGFFFMEAVGWGQWTVATVDLARRGDSGERNGGAVSSKL
jgi:hypothetical protein